MLKKQRRMLRPPLYGNLSLRLALEFGTILSETAREQKIKLTPEMVTRAENNLIAEIRAHGAEKTALNFLPLILATLEV